MAIDDAAAPENSVLSTASGWTVYECGNGCLHIRLHHITLNLSVDEFAQLVKLLGDAYVRLGVRAAVSSAGLH